MRRGLLSLLILIVLVGCSPSNLSTDTLPLKEITPKPEVVKQEREFTQVADEVETPDKQEVKVHKLRTIPTVFDTNQLTFLREGDKIRLTPSEGLELDLELTAAGLSYFLRNITTSGISYSQYMVLVDNNNIPFHVEAIGGNLEPLVPDAQLVEFTLSKDWMNVALVKNVSGIELLRHFRMGHNSVGNMYLRIKEKYDKSAYIVSMGQLGLNEEWANKTWSSVRFFNERREFVTELLIDTHELTGFENVSVEWQPGDLLEQIKYFEVVPMQ